MGASPSSLRLSLLMEVFSSYESPTKSTPIAHSTLLPNSCTGFIKVSIDDSGKICAVIPSTRHPGIELIADLSGSGGYGKLTPGTYWLHADFALPKDAPPSFKPLADGLVRRELGPREIPPPTFSFLGLVLLVERVAPGHYLLQMQVSQDGSQIIMIYSNINGNTAMEYQGMAISVDATFSWHDTWKGYLHFDAKKIVPLFPEAGVRFSKISSAYLFDAGAPPARQPSTSSFLPSIFSKAGPSSLPKKNVPHRPNTAASSPLIAMSPPTESSLALVTTTMPEPPLVHATPIPSRVISPRSQNTPVNRAQPFLVPKTPLSFRHPTEAPAHRQSPLSPVSFDVQPNRQSAPPEPHQPIVRQEALLPPMYMSPMAGGSTSAFAGGYNMSAMGTPYASPMQFYNPSYIHPGFATVNAPYGYPMESSPRSVGSMKTRKRPRAAPRNDDHDDDDASDHEEDADDEAPAAKRGRHQ